MFLHSVRSALKIYFTSADDVDWELAPGRVDYLTIRNAVGWTEEGVRPKEFIETNDYRAP